MRRTCPECRAQELVRAVEPVTVFDANLGDGIKVGLVRCEAWDTPILVCLSCLEQFHDVTTGLAQARAMARASRGKLVCDDKGFLHYRSD